MAKSVSYHRLESCVVVGAKLNVQRHTVFSEGLLQLELTQAGMVSHDRKCVQSLRFDGLACIDKRGRRWRNDQPRFLVQRNNVDVSVLLGKGKMYEGKIQFAFGELVYENRLVCCFSDVKGYLRSFDSKQPDRLGQQMDGDTLVCPDIHGSELTFGKGCKFQFGHSDLFENLLSMIEQQSTHRREPHGQRPSRAVEDQDIQLFFQTSDLLTDRGLAVAERLSRSTEGAFSCHSAQRHQMSQLDPSQKIEMRVARSRLINRIGRFHGVS